jgi:DNA-binding beta-propeller fold protein YncE
MAFCAGCGARAPKSATDYRLLQRVNVGGEGRWDYVAVDEKYHRLFVPRSTHVMVLDLSTQELKQVGDIPQTDGVHGVAFDYKGGHGFTSNGRDNSITVFELKTLKVIGKVKAGTNPDAIVFDPASRRVFAMNHTSGDVTAFSAEGDFTRPVETTTIAVGGTLEYAVVDEAGHLYVNVEDKNQTVAIDTRTMKVDGRWELGEGEEPTGLAIDIKRGLLFAVCHNRKLVVLDCHSGKIVATLPIGGNVDGCAFDSDRNLAFTSNGEGTVTVVSDADSARPTVVGTVTTQRGARTIAVDSATHRLYLPAEDSDAKPAGTATTRPAPAQGSFVILVVG